MEKLKDIKPIRLDEKDSSNFLQKIRNFIQYNNAFVLIVVFVLGVSGVALGNENIREGVLLGKQEKEYGVDNGVLLAADVENWDFQTKIIDIEEDEEYYYVGYQFKTLGVKDNIWQELWRENLLKFEKESDRYTDVASYITKEIGEVVWHEYELLKNTQKAARNNGRTQRIKVVAYNGLVGKALNFKEKVILQENPLIKEEAIQSAQQNTTQEQTPCIDCATQQTIPKNATIDKEIIRQIVEEILNEKSKIQNPEFKNEGDETIPTETKPTENISCVSVWQCSEWQPALDQSLCGKKVSQTRTCNDVNNCGKKEGKPVETQEIQGPECESKEEG